MKWVDMKNGENEDSGDNDCIYKIQCSSQKRKMQQSLKVEFKINLKQNKKSETMQKKKSDFTFSCLRFRRRPLRSPRMCR